jgi:hypothetical protein
MRLVGIVALAAALGGCASVTRGTTENTGAAGFAGNVLLGGLIGMGVDAATGAAQDHKPNPVIVTMKPIGPAAPSRQVRPARKPARPAPEAGT